MKEFMIDLRRLEELQKSISTMEWDMENGQFNKRKAEYYRMLLKERDTLLNIKSLYLNDESEDDEGSEAEDEDGYRLDERQIAGV
ncbi:hypothetical protein J4470_04010 [Candidatus Woesearchaeota archaeon]|nr:hypothetical protein [Candidatus Woesearchaeota archaeon]